MEHFHENVVFFHKMISNRGLIATQLARVQSFIFPIANLCLHNAPRGGVFMASKVYKIWSSDEVRNHLAVIHGY